MFLGGDLEVIVTHEALKENLGPLSYHVLSHHVFQQQR